MIYVIKWTNVETFEYYLVLITMLLLQIHVIMLLVVSWRQWYMVQHLLLNKCCVQMNGIKLFYSPTTMFNQHSTLQQLQHLLLTKCCYTPQLKCSFLLDKSISRDAHQTCINSLGWTKLNNSLGLGWRQLEPWTCTWSGRAS